MDIFLVKDGVVENIAVFDTLEQAQLLNPTYTCIERVEANMHINPMDTYL